MLESLTFFILSILKMNTNLIHSFKYLRLHPCTTLWLCRIPVQVLSLKSFASKYNLGSLSFFGILIKFKILCQVIKLYIIICTNIDHSHFITFAMSVNLVFFISQFLIFSMPAFVHATIFVNLCVLPDMPLHSILSLNHFNLMYRFICLFVLYLFFMWASLQLNIFYLV